MIRLLHALLALLCAGAAHAQSADARWPERPIHFIVPARPAAVPTLWRGWSPRRRAPGQQIVVENRVAAAPSPDLNPPWRPSCG